MRNYKRDRKGRFAKVNTLSGTKVKKALSKAGNPAVVPYARASLRSQTVGVNSGVNLSDHRRLSAGFYVRVERRSQSDLEKKIKATDRKVVHKITRKISPHREADPYVEKAIKKARQKVVNKTLGGQKRVGGNAYARLTTTQGGLPSVSVRKGMAKVPASKRRKAIDDYNARMSTALKGNRVKKPRPQRRTAAARKVA